MNQQRAQPFWQAAVYTRSKLPFDAPSRKQVYTGIFQTREEAEAAGHRLCHKIKGVGYVCLKIDT